MLSLTVLRYIAEEVTRQRDEPLAVYWMATAWATAMLHDGLPVTPKLIEEWGMMVHPYNNEAGFRTSRVRVGDYIAPEPVLVPRMIENLCAGIAANKATWPNGLDPDQAYREFQTIHPFRDGNGRTGKILYNYLRGTLADPVMPPNFFNCANP